jgi:ribokinase
VTAAPRIAVVGHCEWVIHTDAPFIPAAGEIVHLRDPVEQPAGGGAVTAVALARWGGEVTFYTALGNDGRVEPALTALGVRVRGAPRPVPHTQALVMRDPTGERTIAVIGENLHPAEGDDLPWDELDACDAAYFTGMDPGTLRLARRARVLVVTARRFDVLAESGVHADVLIGSGRDRGELFDLTRLERPPTHVIVTDGERGGTGYEAVPPPSPVVDTYGAGDTFAAGVVWGLAVGLPLAEALRLAATRSAEALTWRGSYP